MECFHQLFVVVVFFRVERSECYEVHQQKMSMKMKRLNWLWRVRLPVENRHPLINAFQLSNAKIEIEMKIARQVHRTVWKDRRDERDDRKKKNKNVNYRKEFYCVVRSKHAVNDSRRDENQMRRDEKREEIEGDKVHLLLPFFSSSSSFVLYLLSFWFLRWGES